MPRRTKDLEPPEDEPAPEDDEDDGLADAADAADSVVAELERLVRLRSDGHLTASEFADAKERVLGAPDEWEDDGDGPEEEGFLRWAPWWMVGVVIGGTLLALLTLGAVDPLFTSHLAYVVGLITMWATSIAFAIADGRAHEREGRSFFGGQIVVLVLLGAWGYLLGRAYLRKGSPDARGDHWLAVPLMLALQVIVLSQAVTVANVTAPGDGRISLGDVARALSAKTPSAPTATTTPRFVVLPELAIANGLTGTAPRGMANCSPGTLTGAAAGEAGGDQYAPITESACAWGWAVGLGQGGANLFVWNSGWQWQGSGTQAQLQSLGAGMGAPAIFVQSLELQAKGCPSTDPYC